MWPPADPDTYSPALLATLRRIRSNCFLEKVRKFTDSIIEEFRRSRGVQHSASVVDPFLELLAERPELWMRIQTSTSG